MPYWPDVKSPKEVGSYVVTCESEREAADYKVRVLEIAPLHQVILEHRTLSPRASLTQEVFKTEILSSAAEKLSHHLAVSVHELA